MTNQGYRKGRTLVSNLWIAYITLSLDSQAIVLSLYFLYIYNYARSIKADLSIGVSFSNIYLVTPLWEKKKNIDINREVLETENKSGCRDFQLSQRYLVSNMVCLTQ